MKGEQGHTMAAHEPDLDFTYLLDVFITSSKWNYISDCICSFRGYERADCPCGNMRERIK
eukprot:1097644-Pelagomonas_calceolata.AAC.3